MWRNWNPCTLWVGMQNGAASVENSMEVPQKLKIELPYDPAIPLLGIHLKECKSGPWIDVSILMSIVALFTIPTIWKQPESPSMNEWIKMWYICKQCNIIQPVKRRKFCNMWQHGWTLRMFAKWNKSEGKRQIPYDFTHLWYPKQSKTKQTNKLIDTENRSVVTSGKGGRSTVWWWMVTRLVVVITL